MPTRAKPLAPPIPRELIAYIDGGSPAAYGVVIQDSQGRTVETFSQFLGRATNNVAEYEALLAALEYATARRPQRLRIYSDSELVAKQMQGLYRVQSPDLKPLFDRARKLAGRFAHFVIAHVPREQNHLADRLVNEALNRAQSLPGSNRQSFFAVAEGGYLKPLPPLPDLEEGAEYEVRAVKRPQRPTPS